MLVTVKRLIREGENLQGHHVHLLTSCWGTLDQSSAQKEDIRSDGQQGNTEVFLDAPNVRKEKKRRKMSVNT
jgi:hypothetical protein